MAERIIEGTKAMGLPAVRKSAEEAGYMELRGAGKDGDCSEVKVPGGISREKGCCNEFEPQSDDTEVFSCGTCEYKREG